MLHHQTDHVDQTVFAPAPLRSDAIVPLRSGLCDMNKTICRVRHLRRAPNSGEGAIPVGKKKKKKKKMCRAIPATGAHTSALPLNADDHN